MDRVTDKRCQPMHTGKVAGHSNLSSSVKIFAALYVGTDSVGVSYYDPVSHEVKSFWPPLNRKHQDKFSIATEIMKIMEEKEILGFVMSGKDEGEEQSENYLKDEAGKVESVFEDLISTGILTGIGYTYYDVNVTVNQLMVKKIVEQLTIKGDSRFISVDMTELEVRFAAEFLLMHFLATEVLTEMPVELQGFSCAKKRRNERISESLVIDIETVSNEYEFLLDNLGHTSVHWKI
ncbi:hypothetical protein Ddye_029969 [Dipteronia dyeriana]|uniref:Uncharacterized protein n=1 Tax=Dipteronia dyeriana TaxID=168575 RepID=A0AAD9WM19_9ROSI|nr:hypothetical protein Ddye_029969 [Dipteronia dyeriana]